MAFAPGLAGDLGAVLLGKGLVFYFGAYLVGGYLMYAALFAGIGAFCESQRDAQTLLGPIMIVMTIPIIFMSQAIRSPDSPILSAAVLDPAVHAVPDAGAHRRRPAGGPGDRHDCADDPDHGAIIAFSTRASTWARWRRGRWTWGLGAIAGRRGGCSGEL
jgi:hypothetical protein